MSSFDIVIDEHEMYRNPFAIVREVMKCMKHTDYFICFEYEPDVRRVKFVLELHKRVKEYKNDKGEIIRNPDEPNSDGEYDDDEDGLKEPLVQYKCLFHVSHEAWHTFNKFTFNSDEPAYPQLVEYVRYFEREINYLLSKLKTDITCHFNVLHYNVNDMDYCKGRVFFNTSSESDEEDKQRSSTKISRTMALNRSRLTEELRKNSGLGRLSEPSETFEIKLTEKQLEKIKSNISIENAYCVKLGSYSEYYVNCELMDVLEDIVHHNIDLPKNYFIASYPNKSGGIYNINKHEFFSYFIGSERKNKAIILTWNGKEGPATDDENDPNHYVWICKYETYLIYNLQNEVQTLLLDDDGASEYLTEFMFADNGKMFECYERFDGECEDSNEHNAVKVETKRYKAKFIVDNSIQDPESDSDDDEEEEVNDENENVNE